DRCGLGDADKSLIDGTPCLLGQTPQVLHRIALDKCRVLNPHGQPISVFGIPASNSQTRRRDLVRESGQAPLVGVRGQYRPLQSVSNRRHVVSADFLNLLSCHCVFPALPMVVAGPAAGFGGMFPVWFPAGLGADGGAETGDGGLDPSRTDRKLIIAPTIVVSVVRHQEATASGNP